LDTSDADEAEQERKKIMAPIQVADQNLMYEFVNAVAEKRVLTIND